ncbi:MAG: Asp-tRNA(Asn)/Glu-tRNA(Gln) amidotransferase GatCAB subunit C, partial [Mycobacterium sp.]|nr:Asp-tRNA(Asn)/Glu-tRNA(Gln) amidotransferase GatCAB subunit C [Mycobacterium sp.]
HGEIALGWDRIVALLFGADSIRDVIAFHKSSVGVDPLTDAPAPITAQQRKESGMDAKRGSVRGEAAGNAAAG